MEELSGKLSMNLGSKFWMHERFLIVEADGVMNKIAISIKVTTFLTSHARDIFLNLYSTEKLLALETFLATF